MDRKTLLDLLRVLLSDLEAEGYHRPNYLVEQLYNIIWVVENTVWTQETKL